MTGANVYHGAIARSVGWLPRVSATMFYGRLDGFGEVCREGRNEDRDQRVATVVTLRG